MNKKKLLFPRWDLVLLVVLLAAGLGLRLIDLTNPPLDFHPDRQLHGAIIARGMYYQMLPGIDPAQKQLAVNLWKSVGVYEPPILERIVALTYFVVGGEYLWIARIYSSVFWMIGGLALYELARRMTSVGGGLAALALYLFVPFSVIASRSFQPDPFMVMGMLLAVYSLYCWSEERTWKWALFTGLFTGLAVLVKAFAGVMLAPALVIMVLNTVGWRKVALNRQVWSMAGISTVIPGLYYLFSISSRSVGFIDFWVLSYTNLLLKPRFYFAWLSTAGIVIGIGTIFFSLASVLLLSVKGRALTLGLWLGYALFGLLEPYQITTHDYYSLAIIPLAALSLSPIFGLIIDKVRQQSRFLQIFFTSVILLYVLYQGWLVRNVLVSSDYRGEAVGWTQMGAGLPRDGRIIALTHDYGTRISYFGFIQVSLWPYVQDFDLLGMQNGEQGNGQLTSSDFEQYFNSKIDGYQYFLVTRFDELDAQPLLKDKLYSTYPILQEGNGHILFDLAHPLTTPQP